MALADGTDALAERAARLLVGGGQGHKRRSEIPGYPQFAVRGKGCRFWDDQEREFIDYLCAYGPILLGYAHPVVDAAVKRQMDQGVIFDVGHPSEIELAEKLVELLPCAEMVSFFTGGSGATTGAVRVARSYTGREKVVRLGYHGWHDWCRTGDRGVPECLGPLTLGFGYNDLESLERIFAENPGQIACVIMEAAVTVPPVPGFLEGVKQVCHENGTLCIFDEVKTGFRYAYGGAHEYYGVTPDLATFGKAMANGYDIGVLAGKREILSACGDVWLAATFHAHLTGIAATLATIGEMKAIDGISLIWRQGRKLIDGLNEIVQKLGVDARCCGDPPMPQLKFGEGGDRVGRLFWEGAAKRGVYFHPGHPWFVSTAHDDQVIELTLRVAGEAMSEACQNAV